MLERKNVKCTNDMSSSFSYGNEENCANEVKPKLSDVCSSNFFYNPTLKTCYCEKKNKECEIENVYEPPFYNQYRLSPGSTYLCFWNKNYFIHAIKD